MRSGTRTSARVAVAAVAMIVACGPKGSSLRRAEETSAAVSWAIGSGHRVIEPEVTDAFLLLVRADVEPGSMEGTAPSCARATSILPVPGADPRVFLVIDGKLHVQGEEGGPRPMGGALAGRISRLLAVVEGAAPLELLVAFRGDGDEVEELWRLMVSETAIVKAMSAHGDPRLASAAAFFRAFVAPRCAGPGERCLVVSTAYDETFVDLEDRRGGRRTPLLAMGEREVVDAAWASSEELYLLVTCAKETP